MHIEPVATQRKVLLVMNKTFGKVKIKKVRPDLADIPNDCGYEKRFEYTIDMNSNGISAECVAWCVQNCKSKWGWHFTDRKEYSADAHNWEETDAFMSFADKKEATKFWLSIGGAHLNNRDN
jgi:hypothetical protein